MDENRTGADSCAKTVPAALVPPTGFCNWKQEGSVTECGRCGSVNYEGRQPTCPPWVTRVEPDNKRLPHIKNIEQNTAAYQAWMDAEAYKTPRPPLFPPAASECGGAG